MDQAKARFLLIIHFWEALICAEPHEQFQFIPRLTKGSTVALLEWQGKRRLALHFHHLG
jgi:hypothetical protein